MMIEDAVKKISNATKIGILLHQKYSKEEYLPRVIIINKEMALSLIQFSDFLFEVREDSFDKSDIIILPKGFD